MEAAVQEGKQEENGIYIVIENGGKTQRPEERRRQAETRHKTAAGLPPLDILIPTGSPITAIASYR